MQHSGADLERGIAFLLEGALDTQAAAHRFLVAAGNELPKIDVSGPLQQACFPPLPLGCDVGSNILPELMPSGMPWGPCHLLPSPVNAAQKCLR